MRVRQHCSGSSLDDSPLTGEIDPLSEATRLNPVVRRQATPGYRHRVVGHAVPTAGRSDGQNLLAGNTSSMLTSSTTMKLGVNG